jgi:hypothetical protein
MSVTQWWEEDHEWDRSPEKQVEWAAVVQAFSGRLDAGRDWVRAQCPMCVELEGKDDYKESLGYNHWTGRYKCFKCGAWGYLPISQRVALLDASDVVEVERQRREVELQPATGFVALFEEPGWSAGSFDWARKYLRDPVSAKPRGRGLSDEVSRAAGLGAALTGLLGGRVVVPVPDYSDPDKPWKGWVARAVYDSPGIMPYRYPKGFERRGLLYNEPALYLDTNDPVYIVEGCFDALSLWPDGVAVFGKHDELQFERMLHARRPICVALDGDAFTGAQQLAWDLQHRGKMAWAVQLPPKKDPDDVGKAWLRAQFDRLMTA